jgi:sortase A
VVGSVLMVCAALALVWGFTIWRWGDPVTALYTARQQRALARDYRAIEQSYVSSVARRTPRGRETTRDLAVARRTAAHAYRVHSKTGRPLGRIMVPALGLNMVIVTGTDHDSLRRGPGWDQRTYLPGEGQLVYIAGHRTTYRAPFAHIDRLKPGDRIEVTLPYGRFTYRVTHHVIVPANDVGRLVSHGHEEIALQACHPRFSAKQRYIVYARPVAVSPAVVS